MHVYKSIWHHNLYCLAVVGVLGAILRSQGLISRHIEPAKSSPPHQHQTIYIAKCLNGHNLGLELLFSSCKQKIVFYGAISGFSNFREKDHIISRPTAPNWFKRPCGDPPMGQMERSECHNPGWTVDLARYQPNTWIWWQNVGFWRHFEVKILNLSTHAANSVLSTSQQST